MSVWSLETCTDQLKSIQASFHAKSAIFEKNVYTINYSVKIQYDKTYFPLSSVGWSCWSCTPSAGSWSWGLFHSFIHPSIFNLQSSIHLCRILNFLDDNSLICTLLGDTTAFSSEDEKLLNYDYLVQCACYISYCMQNSLFDPFSKD